MVAEGNEGEKGETQIAVDKHGFDAAPLELGIFNFGRLLL